MNSCSCCCWGSWGRRKLETLQTPQHSLTSTKRVWSWNYPFCYVSRCVECTCAATWGVFERTGVCSRLGPQMCFIYICRNYAKATFSTAFFHSAVVWPHSFLSCFVLLWSELTQCLASVCYCEVFSCNLIDTHIIVNFQKHGHGTPSQFTDSDNSEKRVQQASKLHLLLYYTSFRYTNIVLNHRHSKIQERRENKSWDLAMETSWIACKGLAFCLLTFNWQSESFFATDTS